MLVGEPGVEIGQRLERWLGSEEAAAHHADLVLDLPLLPPSRRRAGRRLDQVMAHQL
jgi:hypothetical protein